MKALFIQDFPDDLHKALKIKAIEDGTSLKETVIKLLRAGLETEKKEK